MNGSVHQVAADAARPNQTTISATLMEHVVMTRDYKFGDQKPQKTFELTPLGAAHVEAMPDDAKRRKIQKAFDKQGKCPTSEVFNAEQVEAFYKAKGLNVTAVSSS